MRKRQKEAEEAYEAMWDNGKGSHHPDYDPEAVRRPPLLLSTQGTAALARRLATLLGSFVGHRLAMCAKLGVTEESDFCC